MTSSPSRYNLSDATTPCYESGKVCSNPASHLYWDATHPTTTIHRYIAQRLAKVLFA